MRPEDALGRGWRRLRGAGGSGGGCGKPLLSVLPEPGGLSGTGTGREAAVAALCPGRGLGGGSGAPRWPRRSSQKY